MLRGKKSKFRPRINKWNSNIARREVNCASQLAKYYDSLTRSTQHQECGGVLAHEWGLLNVEPGVCLLEA